MRGEERVPRRNVTLTPTSGMAPIDGPRMTCRS
jgi:hypothetical protein